MTTVCARFGAALGVRTRYFIVRSISRGGDIIISYTFETQYGGTGLIYLIALGLGGIWNIGIDYPGQKFWVNKGRPQEEWITLSEAGRYTFLRIFYIPLSLAVHAFLYKGLEVPFIASSLITSLFLWVITYKNSRGVFSPKSTRWIPWPLRSVVLQRRNAKKGPVR